MRDFFIRCAQTLYGARVLPSHHGYTHERCEWDRNAPVYERFQNYRLISHIRSGKNFHHCWMKSFPNAEMRISRPKFDDNLILSRELIFRFMARPHNTKTALPAGRSLRKADTLPARQRHFYYSGNEIIAGVILAMFCGCRVAASKTAFQSIMKSAIFYCRFHNHPVPASARITSPRRRPPV